MKKILETTIPTNLEQALAPKGLKVHLTQSEWGYDVGVIALSKMLGLKKNKEQKTAVTITDLKGNLVIAGIVELHENEGEAEVGGNWSYVLTFDKEDLEGCKIYDISENGMYSQIFSDELIDKHNCTMNATSSILTLVIGSFEVLKLWLDANASTTEEISVECKGSFVATVSVVNGEKEMCITPAAEQKLYIKDDEAIEA